MLCKGQANFHSYAIETLNINVAEIKYLIEKIDAPPFVFHKSQNYPQVL